RTVSCPVLAALMPWRCLSRRAPRPRSGLRLSWRSGARRRVARSSCSVFRERL
ncbi:hypothetical protein BN1708_018334, partial [Verticillium longisporum]